MYDGANATQELTSGTVTANLLSGGIDETFSRADSSGTVTPLQDALGGTIALVDTSGNIVTSYSYDPFGNTTSSGLVSGWADEVGVGTPQAGASGGYTFDGQDTRHILIWLGQNVEPF